MKNSNTDQSQLLQEEDYCRSTTQESEEIERCKIIKNEYWYNLFYLSRNDENIITVDAVAMPNLILDLRIQAMKVDVLDLWLCEMDCEIELAAIKEFAIIFDSNPALKGYIGGSRSVFDVCPDQRFIVRSNDEKLVRRSIQLIQQKISTGMSRAEEIKKKTERDYDFDAAANAKVDAEIRRLYSELRKDFSEDLNTQIAEVKLLHDKVCRYNIRFENWKIRDLILREKRILELLENERQRRSNIETDMMINIKQLMLFSKESLALRAENEHLRNQLTLLTGSPVPSSVPSMYDGSEVSSLKTAEHSMSPTPSLAKQLLTHVIAGDQPAAEALLEKYPNQNLASIEETVQDHAGRTFKGTALQCAVASLDWFMWRMLLKKDNISRQLAAEQLLEIEYHPYAKAILTNWQQMLLDYYTCMFIAKLPYTHGVRRFLEENKDIWVQHVGKCQHDSPMHVLQEFCNPGRPFEPTPDFKAMYSLIRKLPDQAKISKLGNDWSFWRGDNEKALMRCDNILLIRTTRARARACTDKCKVFIPVDIIGNKISIARADRQSLYSLLETRTIQREELVSSLTQRLPRPRLR